MMLKKLIPLLLMVGMLFVVSCDNPTDDDPGGGNGSVSNDDIVGTWTSSAGNTIVLNDDGTATVSGEEYKTYSNATWEKETVEWTEFDMDAGTQEDKSADGIGIYNEDEDGSFVLDAVFVETDDGTLTLVDKGTTSDSDETFTKDGSSSEDESSGGDDDSSDDEGSSDFNFTHEGHADYKGKQIGATSGGSADTNDTWVLNATGAVMYSDGVVVTGDQERPWKFDEATKTLTISNWSGRPDYEFVLQDDGTFSHQFFSSDPEETWEIGAGSTTPGGGSVEYTLANFAGTWTDPNTDAAYTLNSDGTWTYGGGVNSGEWSIDGTTLNIQTDWEIDDSGSEVKLVQRNSAGLVQNQLVSTDAAVVTGEAADSGDSDGSDDTSDDSSGDDTGAGSDDTTEEETDPTAYTMENFAGTWTTSSGDTLELDSDGTGTYTASGQAASITWTISETAVTVDDNGNETEYEIKGSPGNITLDGGFIMGEFSSSDAPVNS